MKWTALAFAFIISISAALPCCGKEDSCLEIKMEEHSCSDTEGNPDQPDTPCSPFYSCGLCGGFVFQQSIMTSCGEVKHFRGIPGLMASTSYQYQHHQRLLRPPQY